MEAYKLYCEMDGLTFECCRSSLSKNCVHVSQQLQERSLIALMPQTFAFFNNIHAKAHDIEIHLNKHKKATKVGGKART